MPFSTQQFIYVLNILTVMKGFLESQEFLGFQNISWSSLGFQSIQIFTESMLE